MEVAFLVYFHMNKRDTVFYLLYENNTAELLISGQEHTIVFLIALLNFYLFMKLAHPLPIHHTTHTHTECSVVLTVCTSMTAAYGKGQTVAMECIHIG